MAGLARMLSKLGHCSRAQAVERVRAGRVTLNGRICRDPEKPVQAGRDRIAVDGVAVQEPQRIYLMLNKPRGLVTSRADERGRATVFECLHGLEETLHLSAVGRLDRASEGLLLFSNDTGWAHRITDPATHVDKTYHVQVDRRLEPEDLESLSRTVRADGEDLMLKQVRLLRQGQKTCWLEITLDEGRNRQIRRVLAAHQLMVKRLVRVRIGTLELGDLAKGQWRRLREEEVSQLSR